MSKNLNIVDFSDLNSLTEFEKSALSKKYKGVEKTSDEWKAELSGKIASLDGKQNDFKSLQYHKGIPLTPEAQKEFDSKYPKVVKPSAKTDAATSVKKD